MQSNVFITRFVGKNLVKLVKVDSTNNYLKTLLSNSKPLPVGTVIMADEQYAGRGQSSQLWLSQAGKNLTFSIYLKPHFLSIKQQFKLNQAVTLGITDYLMTLLGDNCKIKWPNDIYFNDDKIGGVLIENKVRGDKISESVIGIGLNVNQTQFSSELKHASSLANILGYTLNLTALLGNILLAIETRYNELEIGGVGVLDFTFLMRLFRFRQLCHFSNDSKVFCATIIGVSDAGLLILETNNMQQHFNLKEISMII